MRGSTLRSAGADEQSWSRGAAETGNGLSCGRRARLVHGRGRGNRTLIGPLRAGGAAKRGVPRPRRYEMTNDGDSLKCDALNVSEPTGIPATVWGCPCRRVVPWAYLHVITDCIASSGIRRNLSETCRG